MGSGQTISRRSLANYVSEQILAGNSQQALDQVAGYLVQKRATDDYQLIIKDIESKLSDKGLVIIRVTSARPLSNASEAKIKKYILNKTGAKQIELINTIDKNLIGGAMIDTADVTLDASLRGRLNKLKGLHKE